MKPITFELTTVTPVFMAGEDGTSFELRPPSFKGLLRFWWRAAHWGQSQENLSIEDIQQAEGDIFGTAASDGRKSNFSIRISPTEFQGCKTPLPYHKILGQRQGKTFPPNILDYLAHGTYDFKTKTFHREYLKQGEQFTLKFKPSSDKVAKDIITSVYFLVVFGGIGAKSRNGFGSLAVTNPEIFAEYNLPYPFPDKTFFDNRVQNQNLPPFTAFSAYRNEQGKYGMKIFKLKNPSSSWDTCLAELGTIYREAKNRLKRKHEYEKRQYISAPIIAGKQQQSFSDRHAKPYFLRVVKNADGAFDGYILYLPSEYSEGVPQKGDAEEHTPKFLKYCDEFNNHLAAQMGVYYG
ncbi:MAG: type III-B CRISPR module RAMP protein Cmr1 [Candidatus Vecturithrix sp.]|jgi:CRISPR-associated protein Cmr1|nr:type III-B CRISPR module RAMP protein Cmr1 [Candidatus Vecturithrix sp.]